MSGTFKAASIKVAEASKFIENTQRDVSIALINKLTIVFSHPDIDTFDLLDAPATKWNFSRLSHGLVGGHCIGVDPNYLVHKSMAAGHIPNIIRQSREITDGMARHAANRLINVSRRAQTAAAGCRAGSSGTRLLTILLPERMSGSSKGTAKRERGDGPAAQLFFGSDSRGEL